MAIIGRKPDPRQSICYNVGEDVLRQGEVLIYHEDHREGLNET